MFSRLLASRAASASIAARSRLSLLSGDSSVTVGVNLFHKSARAMGVGSVLAIVSAVTAHVLKTSADERKAHKHYDPSSAGADGRETEEVVAEAFRTAAKVGDVILAVAMPFHAYVGLNYVVTDYVPKGLRGVARAGVLGGAVVMLAGLFKLNADGIGVSGTLLSPWINPAAKSAAVAAK